MRSQQFLGEITEQAKKTLKYVLAFSLATNLLMLVLPIYSLQVLDRVLSSYSMDTLLMLTLITVLALCFFGVFYTIRMFICSQLGEWIEAKVSPDVFRHTVEQSAQKLSPQGSQNMRDLTTVKTFLMSPGFQTLIDAPWSPVFLLVIFIISPVLGLIAIGGGAVLMVLAYLTDITTREPSREASIHTLSAIRLSDAANRNSELVEAMGMMQALLFRWQQINISLVKAQNLAASRSEIIASVSKVIRMLIQIAITGVGAFLAMHHQLTVGGMIATSILSGRALAPFEAAIGLWKTVLNVREAYKRLNEDLSQRRSARGSMTLPAPEGKVTVENVYFRPPRGEQLILRGVSFALEPGVSVGIIGPAAAGKSTLTKLVAGVWPCQSGSIRLDGVDIYQWNRDDIGHYIGYLPQDVEMFEGTIRDNIARLRPDASDAQVVEAAQMAGVHDLILRLPDGYETQVREGLVSLSPGQKQRIALARALFGMPRFVVMDEPNSNLDGEGEVALLQALARMKQRRMTAVVVAHKPSIISTMDKILMLRGGVVEAFGNREEILPRYLGNSSARPSPEEISSPKAAVKRSAPRKQS